MHAVVVVLQVSSLFKCLNTCLVNFLWVNVTFESKTEAGATVVGIGGSKVDIKIIFAESVLDVLH